MSLSPKSLQSNNFGNHRKLSHGRVTLIVYLLLSPHTSHGLLSDVRETGNLLPRTMYTQAHFYTFSPECGVVDVQVADVFQPNRSVASITFTDEITTVLSP